LQPREPQPIEIRAAAMIDRGEVEAGLALYRELLTQSDDRETAARHLVLMHYDPAQTNASLFTALRAFAERHLQPSGPPFSARRDANPKRALRIGWLSPRFTEGPVPAFLTGLLRAFDRSRHKHLLIALQASGDAATTRIRELADEWFDLSGLDEAALLQRLRALELDVLIDLAGHSTANRLAVVAQRVAPVQVSWLDWFDTTAAPSMDAWISDRWLTPDDVNEEEIASARVLYLEGYLWDEESAKDASRKAIAAVKCAGGRVALSVSDSFCIGRFRSEFLHLLDRDVNILFANEDEAKALFEEEDFDKIIAAARKWGGITALTRSAKGCVIVQEDMVQEIPALPVSQVIDTTGAGDQFAAGFLYGLATGRDLETAGRMGCIAAAEVITHFGARPDESVLDLFRKAGLL
jgi:hypothetical protein